MLYPKFIAASRRTKIDMVLPHAAAFCYGMSKGGTPVYEIFKQLAKNQHIYSEISREALYIVRDAELLGFDIITAIKNTAITTPSDKFKEFLENLVPMVESGSNLHQYFDHAKKTQEMFLKTLELICEVYVVAFVAVPIFFLITLITMSLVQTSQAPYIFQALFIGLPVGSIAMIIIIDAISPKEELAKDYPNKFILKKTIHIKEEINEVEYKHKIDKYEKKKRTNKLVKHLKNPLSLFYDEPMRAMFIGIPLMFIPFLLHNLGLDKQLLLAAVLAIAPLSIAYELKMRRLAKLDKAIPDFLRRLAEMNEIGLTLKNAIGLLLKSDIGLLSREVKRMWLDMEWGGGMKEALVRFENRIGTPALKRAITLIVKASEVSSDTRDVLLIAAEDAENMVSLRKDRFDTAFIYVATIYIAFGTFVYVCYSFSMQFMPSITKMGAEAVNTTEIGAIMFATCGILGLFSGLITGQMAEGSLFSGLKHSVILLLFTYGAFTMLMGY
jgi:flagellar protein FlaJ